MMIQIETAELLRMLASSLFDCDCNYRHDVKDRFSNRIACKLRNQNTGQDAIQKIDRYSNIRYEYEFDFEENFKVRFNYIPGCQGGAWTPDDPEEVEIVQVLFFDEPLTGNQENAFKDTNTEQLEEACWSRMDEDEGPLPHYVPGFY